MRTPGPLQYAGEARRGELAALVGVEDLRPPEPRQGLLQSLNAELHVHGVRYPPGQHLARRPVHHRDQVEKAAPHRQVGDVGAPDLVRPIDRQIPQQIREDLVLGVRHRRPRPLVDWCQAHLRHQPPDALAADRIALAPQVPCHLPRAVPGRLQELRVDQTHQFQVQRVSPAGRW